LNIVRSKQGLLIIDLPDFGEAGLYKLNIVTSAISRIVSQVLSGFKRLEKNIVKISKN